MRGIAAIPVALLAVGAGLVIHSVLLGSASLAFFLVVPVVTGRSVEFLAGAAIVFVGLLALPFTTAGAFEPVPSGPPLGDNENARSVGGGVVLVGPVPIFFGSWRQLAARWRWAVAIAGAALFVAALVAWWLVA